MLSPLAALSLSARSGPSCDSCSGGNIEGGSVLDIGAHRGEYSYWMHRQFRRRHARRGVRAAARVGRVSHRLQAIVSARSHARSRRSDCRRTAARLRMHRPRSHWAAATVDEFCYDDADTEVFDVPVTTIDEYLAEHPELRPVRFIKCDVEYHEAEVLAGAERTLREDRPELLVEWSTPRRAYRERLFDSVQQLGYSMFQFEYGRLDALHDGGTAQPAVVGVGAELCAAAAKADVRRSVQATVAARCVRSTILRITASSAQSAGNCGSVCASASSIARLPWIVK